MPKLEVMKLMSHLVITLTIIIAYVVLLFTTGKDNATLQGCIFAIIGYWFGAIGLNNAKKDKDNEV